MSEISVVLPAYNEEKRIGNSLQKIVHYFSAVGRFDQFEIIVVDDGSTDNTKEIIKSYRHSEIILLENGLNRGKGFSVKKGILHAKYPLILFTDSDLSTPIHELDNLVRFIDKGYDIVIGSRNLSDGSNTVERSLSRTLMSRGFNVFVSSLACRGFRDTQCGFKLFRSSAIKEVVQYQQLHRFSFDVEILFIAKKCGYNIKEVPVLWCEEKGSKVNPINDGVRMVFDLFKIRCMNITGKYTRT